MESIYVLQVRMSTGPNVIGDGILFDSSRTMLLVTNGGGSYGGQVPALIGTCLTLD